MKKSVVFAAIAIVLAGGGWALQKSGYLGKGETQDPNAQFVSVAQKRDIDFSVDISGDVAPEFSLDVKSEVSGKIKALHVEAGDTVKQGELLAEIDDTDLLTEKQSVATEIDGAKLEVEKDRRNYERAKELFESKLISREQYDNLTSEFEMAQNALARAQRKIEIVEDKLRKTKVISPMDGTVLTRPVIQGLVVIAAASVNSGTTLMTVANLDRLLVETHVNQVDVSRLKVDQVVKLRADSIPDTTMTGRIKFIAPTAVAKNSIKGFQVQAIIQDPSTRLRPGMSVNLSVPIERAADAVSVPIAAVFKGEGDKRVVYVRNGAATEPREVVVGVTNFDHAEIKSGVRVGETIMLVEPRGAGVPAGAGGEAKPDGGGREGGKQRAS